MDNYGIDWDGPVPTEVNELGNENLVNVPETNCPLGMEQLNLLRQNIDPLRQSNCHGIDCNLEYLQFLMNEL